jgi:hypothetical protein
MFYQVRTLELTAKPACPARWDPNVPPRHRFASPNTALAVEVRRPNISFKSSDPASDLRPDLALISDCALNSKSNGCNDGSSVIRLFIRRDRVRVLGVYPCYQRLTVQRLASPGTPLVRGALSPAPLSR